MEYIYWLASTHLYVYFYYPSGSDDTWRHLDFNRHPTIDNRQVNRGVYKTMTGEDNCFEHKWVEDFIY